MVAKQLAKILFHFMSFNAEPWSEMQTFGCVVGLMNLQPHPSSKLVRSVHYVVGS